MSKNEIWKSDIGGEINDIKQDIDTVLNEKMSVDIQGEVRGVTTKAWKAARTCAEKLRDILDAEDDFSYISPIAVKSAAHSTQKPTMRTQPSPSLEVEELTAKVHQLAHELAECCLWIKTQEKGLNILQKQHATPQESSRLAIPNMPLQSTPTNCFTACLASLLRRLLPRGWAAVVIRTGHHTDCPRVVPSVCCSKDVMKQVSHPQEREKEDDSDERVEKGFESARIGRGNLCTRTAD